MKCCFIFIGRRAGPVPVFFQPLALKIGINLLFRGKFTIPFLRFEMALHVAIKIIMKVIATHVKCPVVNFTPCWLP